MRVLIKAAMLTASPLFFCCLAWAGDVHVYVDREIRPALLQQLNRAERTIDIEMFTLTDDAVITMLERVEVRGVQVRVILDPNQKSNQRNVDRLKSAGAEMKWFPVAQPALMHRKLAIVDGQTVVAGSVNWTANGFTRNEELMLVIEDPAIAQHLMQMFSDDWYRSWLGRYPSYRE